MQKLQSFKVKVTLYHCQSQLLICCNLKKENYAIVNIEEETQVTTVVNDQINDVEVFQIGMKRHLKRNQIKRKFYTKKPMKSAKIRLYILWKQLEFN